MKQSSTAKTRENAGFNPYREVLKILDFADESGRAGHDKFTVFVKDGNLTWAATILPKKFPGFITVIDRVKWGAGMTSNAWDKLQSKIAIEMCKQRKAW